MGVFVFLALAAMGLSSVCASEPIHYVTRIEGDLDRSLRKLLRKSSELLESEQHLFSLTGVVRRAEADVSRFRKVLRSEGYYDGRVSYAIDTDDPHPVVTVTVVPGPRYRLDIFRIIYIPSSDETVPDSLPISRAELGIDGEAPARGALVLGTQSDLLAQLNEEGYPFARIMDRDIVVDHDTDTMEVVVTVELARRAKFGTVSVQGLNETRSALVIAIKPFVEGDLYASSKLRRYKDALEDLGLFSSVSVETESQLNADGSLDVRVKLQERRPRTVGAGLDYSTYDGARGRIFWIHRNLFGEAQRFRTTLVLSDPEQSLANEFQFPHFRRRGQTLFSNLTLTSAARDAFDEESVVGGIGLSRPLGPNLLGSAALEFDVSDTRDVLGERRAYLLSSPLRLDRDTSNDLFNPTEGHRLGVSVAPHVGKADSGIVFLRIEGDAAVYRALGTEGRIVLAARLGIGSLLAENTGDLPPDERLYSGGGGSLRAFAYQEAGPLAPDRTPAGGRSLIESAFEIRWRVTDKFGFVPFIEAGGVFDRQYPDFSDDIFYGGGVGLRYFTPIGPIRADVAIPINRREEIDEPFQLYVSLGQAF